MKVIHFFAAGACLTFALFEAPSWQSAGLALLAYFFLINGLDNGHYKD